MIHKFALSMALLDVLYVTAASDDFNTQFNYMCETYGLDEETLHDALEYRYGTTITLYRERKIPDAEGKSPAYSKEHEDELDDIPWLDIVHDPRKGSIDKYLREQS